MKHSLPSAAALRRFLHVDGIKNVERLKDAKSILGDYSHLINEIEELPGTDLEALEYVLIDEGERIPSEGLTRENWFTARLKHRQWAEKILAESRQTGDAKIKDATAMAWRLWELRVSTPTK